MASTTPAPSIQDPDSTDLDNTDRDNTDRDSTGPDSTDRDNTGPDSTGPDSDPITLSLTATPVLSYALAHNQINVVGRVSVDNRGPALRAAVLRLEVISAGDTLGTVRDLLVDLAAERTATFTDLALTVDPAAMLRVEEQRPATIRASLLVDGVTVDRKSTRLNSSHWE